MNVQNKTKLTRILTLATLLLMVALPLSAQNRTDSLFVFKFYPGNNSFYSPGLNNGEELSRLFDYVNQRKDSILRHDLVLYVNGYCGSVKDLKARRALMKIRSNRVKSELITRKGLKEDCFITRNRRGVGDYVTVRVVPVDKIQNEIQRDDLADKIQSEQGVTEVPQEAPVVVQDSIAVPPDEPIDIAETAGEVVEEVVTIEPEEPVTVSEETLKREKTDSRWALKTNLLDYAILMPNIEIEWMCADRWSVALEMQGAWYAKNEPHKVYRLSTVTAEGRYWAIERARWHGMYVGLFAGAGPYDLCNGKKGHEGEGIMAGVSAGYMFPISKHLSLDAGLGLGYARIRDKVYLPMDGHFLYQYTRKINYFGPLRLKLSLVWRIPK